MKLVITLVCVISFAYSVMLAENLYVPEDSSSNPILNELQIIRSMHEETRINRQKAIEERLRQGSIGDKEKEFASDYAMMSLIEENTHQRPFKDGWNLYGWITISLAIGALIVSIYTYFVTKHTYEEQSKTVENTKKLSQETQRYLLNDLIRHLYRNYVTTYTMRTKMKDIDYNGHPSEEHLKKLKIPMENIHLEAFYGEDDKYCKMHDLYLKFRNYNEEIDVALKHLIDKNISRDTKNEDFDLLEFKVSLLTSRIVATIKDVWGEDEKYVKEVREVIKSAIEGDTNAKNNIDVEGSGRFEELTLEKFAITSYKELFTKEDLKKIVQLFNNDVKMERMKNERGAWKIRMIPF